MKCGCVDRALKNYNYDKISQSLSMFALNRVVRRQDKQEELNGYCGWPRLISKGCRC